MERRALIYCRKVLTLFFPTIDHIFEVKAMNDANSEMFPAQQTAEELEKWTGVMAVAKNLQQTKSSTDTEVVGAQARHILVLTASETSWSVLFDAEILTPKDTVVIYGSQFKQDVGKLSQLCVVL